MKVLRNTDDQLIVENKPVLLAVLVSCFALVFVAAGLFSLSEDKLLGVVFVVGGLIIAIVFNMAFIRRTQIILDRPRNLVELRRKSMLRYSCRDWELSDLDRAEIETSYSGDTDTHRAVLIVTGGMDAGTHPITLVYSSGRGAQRAAEAINGWLARPG